MCYYSFVWLLKRVHQSIQNENQLKIVLNCGTIIINFLYVIINKTYQNEIEHINYNNNKKQCYFQYDEANIYV